jgi:hypothetical protein
MKAADKKMRNHLHLRVQVIVGKPCYGIMRKSKISGKSEWKIQVAHSAHNWRKAKSALGPEHELGAGCDAGDQLCPVGL